ncbi:MAG: phosphate acyltransferase [Eubacteriales bacterium]
MNKLKDLKKLINKKSKSRLVVVSAEEVNILEAVTKAYKDNLIEPILVGNKTLIEEYIKKNNFPLEDVEVVQAENFQKAAEISVKIIKEGKGDFLIKGLVDTSILLKAVLNKEWGLRTGKQLSHVMLYEMPAYHKLLMLTDGGMVTYPDIETKIELIKNAYEAAKKLDYKEFKVACLAAKEKLNPKMQATVEAAEIKERYKNKEFEEGIVIEGPIALDLAVSKEAAEIKKFQSPVAGDADLLLVHNIEMGNGIGKSITYFGNGVGAGVVMGAKVPIVLVSRSDDFNAKYYSILFGSAIS